MILLEKIDRLNALNLLKKYEGYNPYLVNLRLDSKKSKKFTLTEHQVEYIIRNHNKEPIKINRVLTISDFLAEDLQKKHKLKFLPKRVLVQYILGETNKNFHIYGKLTQKQKESQLYWIPKTQLLDDPFFEEIDVDVDFEKYEKIDKRKRSLYDHQKVGVKFLLTRNGCLLADEMGVAKTIQSIIAALESGAEKILVVCPASVKINWKREIECFTKEVAIVNGIRWDSSKFTIINYDILKNFHTVKTRSKKQPKVKNFLEEEGFDIVIIDEAHYLKDSSAKRSKIMLDICRNIDKVWLLTGTPVANYPKDFYNLLRLIKHSLADDYIFFMRRYCDGKRIKKRMPNGKLKSIMVSNGASNLTELHQKTKNIVLRRLKSEVLDMPEKSIIPVYHEFTPTQWEAYDMLWDEYVEKVREEALLEGKSINIDYLQKELVELILLRKFVAMEMIPHTISLVENIIEQGGKVVVFTNFTDELMELQEHFGSKSVIHYGGMNTTEKQHSIDAFMGDKKVKVFIGNQKSAGVGITLTEGTYVVFNSYDWVPGNNQQCEDRCHRMGQKNNVTVYYQLFLKTISVQVWNVLQEKTSNIDEIIRSSITKPTD